MSIVVRYTPVGATPEQYDAVNEALGDEWPPEGVDYHVCFLSEGNVLVSEIWDSREQWQAWGARLLPLLASLGIDPGEPQVFEVHNIMKR